MLVEAVRRSLFLWGDLLGGYNCIWPLQACQGAWLHSLNPKRSNCQGATQLKSNNKTATVIRLQREEGGQRRLPYSSVNINVLCCSPLHTTASAISFLLLPTPRAACRPEAPGFPSPLLIITPWLSSTPHPHRQGAQKYQHRRETRSRLPRPSSAQMPRLKSHPAPQHARDGRGPPGSTRARGRRGGSGRAGGTLRTKG